MSGLFNPFADEGDANKGKDPGFSFYSDPLAAYVSKPVQSQPSAPQAPRPPPPGSDRQLSHTQAGTHHQPQHFPRPPHRPNQWHRNQPPQPSNFPPPGPPHGRPPPPFPNQQHHPYHSRPPPPNARPPASQSWLPLPPPNAPINPPNYPPYQQHPQHPGQQHKRPYSGNQFAGPHPSHDNKRQRHNQQYGGHAGGQGYGKFWKPTFCQDPWASFDTESSTPNTTTGLQLQPPQGSQAPGRQPAQRPLADSHKPGLSSQSGGGEEKSAAAGQGLQPARPKRSIADILASSLAAAEAVGEDRGGDGQGTAWDDEGAADRPWA